MFKTTFSKTAVLCCLGLALCAKVGSAQTCQGAVNGAYAYSAIGTGYPGALFTPVTGSASTFSNTSIGQLLGGIANTGPFALSGTLWFDSSGNIAAAQGSARLMVGTYALNTDCTISATLTDAFGSSKSTTALQGIVLANGSEIDLGVLQNVSNNSVAAPGAFQSSLLIKLVRPLATYCSVSNLTGSYALIATGTRVASLPIGTGNDIVPAQTEASFFMFGRAQFDGSGNIFAPAGPASSLGFLQFVGSYTVNTDCTGTLTLGTVSTVAGTSVTPGATLSVNFVLTQPSVPFTGTRPVIEFNQSSATQTLFGYGEAQ
jgi:hypothetical protein